MPKYNNKIKNLSVSVSDLKPSRKGVRVRLPPSAPFFPAIATIDAELMQIGDEFTALQRNRRERYIVRPVRYSRMRSM